jgi:polyhydroxybutyrate depolymerase
MSPVKRLSIALCALSIWVSLPSSQAHAIAIGQSCAKAKLGARVTVTIKKKKTVLVCRKRSGRKVWIRAAVQTPVTTTTTTTTTTVPEPKINFTERTNDFKPNLRYINVEGMQERSYFFHVPTSYQPGQPVPLLLAFHSRTTDGGEILRTSKFLEWAAAMNFIVASVNASSHSNVTSWNAGNCCSPSTDASENDVLLVSAIIEAVKMNYSIDSERVWAAGHSNGGMMAYRLACDLSDKITAIAVVTGSMVTPSCSPAKSVSVIHLHGDLDPTVPIQGGGKLDTPNVYYSVLDYVKAKACSDNSSTNFTDVEQQFMWNCSNGTQVKLVNYLQQSHEWAEGYSKEILRFLFAHPRK